eukprot:scaffold152692_cov20-Tisochrysis_lutea.AAC.1
MPRSALPRHAVRTCWSAGSFLSKPRCRSGAAPAPWAVAAPSRGAVAASAPGAPPPAALRSPPTSPTCDGAAPRLGPAAVAAVAAASFAAGSRMLPGNAPEHPHIGQQSVPARAQGSPPLAHTPFPALPNRTAAPLQHPLAPAAASSPSPAPVPAALAAPAAAL